MHRQLSPGVVMNVYLEKTPGLMLAEASNITKLDAQVWGNSP